MDLGEIGRTLAERIRDAVGDRQSGATVQISWHDWGTRTSGWLDEEPPDDPFPHVNTYGVLSPDLPRGVYETRLRRDGSYRFSFSFDVDLLAERAGFVFDQDFRYPGHPLPGMPRPAGLEPTGTPTDPAALRQVGALVEEFAERHTAIMGRAPWWAPGASEEEISAAEAQIGVRLPEDLRALFRLVGQDTGESGLLGCYSHDSLETLVEEYCRDDLPGACAGVACDSPLEDIRPVFDADPPGRLKRVFRNDWWVIFGGDRSGEYLAVDLDPDAGGQPGQVFACGSSETPHLVGTSVTAMIEEVVKALRAGRYARHEGDHRIEVHASFTDLPVRRPIESVRDGAEALIGIDRPELVQACYLRHESDLDLTMFEPLSSLRDIGVRGAKTVTPAATNLPLLESLTISAEKADLAALSGHPTLWDLTLSDLTHPVDLAPLATLPNLTRLTIAGLDIPAIDQLTRLPALRVLTLDASQLTRLLASGHRLPDLAALTITGRILLPEAVEFLRQLRGADVHLEEFTGSLNDPPERARA